MASFSPMAFVGRALSSLIVVVSIFLLPNSASVAQELTLDQLIDRNVQALGGRAAIETVQSIKLALHIADPDFEVDAMYYAARPGRMRIDITARGKRVYVEAFNGSRAWQWKEKGEPVEESKTATGALRHGIGVLIRID